jgi:ABC-2 type transport system permease protein
MARGISREVADTLAQTRLEATRGLRRPRFLVLGVALPLAFYISYQVAGIGGANGQALGGIAWPVYLMVSMAAFGAMNAAVGVAAGDWGDASEPVRSGSSRVRRNPRAGPNLFVRGAAAMLLSLPPLLVVGLAAALDGVRLPGLDWLLLAGSLWLGAIPFVALGLLLGLIFDAETGDVVLLFVLVLLAILGGLFQPIDTLPAELAGLAPVLPSFRLADLGWTALADRTVNPVDVLVLAGYTLGFGGVAVWRKRTGDAQVGDRGHADRGHADGEAAVRTRP